MIGLGPTELLVVLFWLVFYVIPVIIGWRIMRAIERIANKLENKVK